MKEENIDTAVVDASFITSYLLPDERIEMVDSIIEQFTHRRLTLVSSPVLPFEVMNAIRSGILRKRITKAKSTKIVQFFLNIDIELMSIEYNQAFQLALEHNLSVYDASYLELAIRQEMPLLTLDNNLLKVRKSL